MFLSIITLSVLLSPFLAAALFSAAHLELPVPLPALPASDSNHSPPGTAPPQLDPSCEANREKDGERVPADPPGLMKMHLLSRDERLVNQVHFTTDYILYNGVCDELNLQSFQSQKIQSGESYFLRCVVRKYGTVSPSKR